MVIIRKNTMAFNRHLPCKVTSTVCVLWPVVFFSELFRYHDYETDSLDSSALIPDFIQTLNTLLSLEIRC